MMFHVFTPNRRPAAVKTNFALSPKDKCFNRMCVSPPHSPLGSFLKKCILDSIESVRLRVFPYLGRDLFFSFGWGLMGRCFWAWILLHLRCDPVLSFA